MPSEVSVSVAPGSVEVILDLATKVPVEARGGLAELVEAFLRATHAGMFSRDPVVRDPPPVYGVVRGNDPEAMHFRWRANAIQMGAYRVLLNTLATYHESSTGLTGMRLLVRSELGDRVGHEAVMRCAFPLRAPSVPFPVRLKPNVGVLKEPLVRFEFRQPLTDQQAEEIHPSCAAWDTLVANGGYREDFDEYLEIRPVVGDTYMAAANVVEHLSYGIIAPEAALDALINAAVGLHFHSYPLAALEFE